MILRLVLISLLAAGCGRAAGPADAPEDADPAMTTFADDLDFLRDHGTVQLLQHPDGGRVALSAAYQGRVMTSAVAPDAPSLGWINRAFIEAGETGTAFDNYGGEDRFWLGPEGGQYALYFAPGADFTFSAWQVPAPLQEGTWTVAAQTDTSVTFRHTMELTNYAGTRFDLEVERTVRVLPADALAARLGASMPEGVQWVGYETLNTVTNTGDAAWTRDGGLPSVWILGMFEPFGTSYVVLPYAGPAADLAVNDDYFGEVPDDRLAVRPGYVLFKCDGEYRSKIGLGPAHARPVMGAYSRSATLLTLVHFDLPEGETDYVNSMWELQDEPYGGDVVNSYNDGPPEPGVAALGGFYELETSSPALALAPGASYTHTHRTVHLSGAPETLDAFSEEVLGVRVSEAEM